MSVTPLKKAKRIKSIAFSFRLLVKGNIKTKIDPYSDPEHKLQGSKKDLSDSPGEINLFAGQSNF